MTSATEHETMARRLDKVRERIALAVQRYQRPPQSVTLLAASKAQTADMMRQAYLLGIRNFGENYLQEAIAKQQALADLQDIVWHFIGPIQSNKTRDIAAHFHWVHSVDRQRIAQRLHEQRPGGLGPLQVCVQVNIGGEPQKAGVAPDQLHDLVACCLRLPNLALRGLMAVPPHGEDPAPHFQALAALLAGLKSAFPGSPLDTLSMGMSADLDPAIEGGATIVRVGTALFGSRPLPPS